MVWFNVVVYLRVGRETAFILLLRLSEQKDLATGTINQSINQS